MVQKNSLIAYENLRKTGKIGKEQYRTLCFIERHPNISANSIGKVLGETSRKRIVELEEMDLIYHSGSKVVFGNRSKTYCVTGKTRPKQRPKKLTSKEKLNILISELKDIHSHTSGKPKFDIVELYVNIPTNIEKTFDLIGETI